MRKKCAAQRKRVKIGDRRKTDSDQTDSFLEEVLKRVICREKKLLLDFVSLGVFKALLVHSLCHIPIFGSFSGTIFVSAGEMSKSHIICNCFEKNPRKNRNYKVLRNLIFHPKAHTFCRIYQVPIPRALDVTF